MSLTRHKDLPAHLSVLPSEEVENLCVGCSACCYSSVILDNNQILVRGLKCKYLGIDTLGKSFCSVYDIRKQVAPWCQNLSSAIAKGLMPNFCPYVSSLKGYKGKQVLGDHEYDIMRQRIQKAVLSAGKPSWVSDEDWEEYVKNG